MQVDLSKGLPLPKRGGARNPPDRRLLILLAILLVGFGAWKLLGGSADAPAGSGVAAPSASTPKTSGGSWAAAVPKTSGGSWAAAVPKASPSGGADATTLDARELAPARFAHQLALIRKVIAPDEAMLQLRVQGDGTLVALIAAGGKTRWLASKDDLHPTAPPTVAALYGLHPLTGDDVDPRVPSKLLRAIGRAKGLAPGTLVLTHPSAGPLGATPTWRLNWPGAPTTIFASADGHHLVV